MRSTSPEANGKVEHSTPAEISEPKHGNLDFDDILKLVGSDGLFQRRIHYLFLVPFIAFVPWLTLNTVFMMYEPDHWCNVPGKPSSTSITDWKNSTIPQDPDSGGFYKCSMYDEERNIVPCINGFTYDTSDYDMTIVSEYNWVCEKENYATMAFTSYYVGGFIGAMVFGWAGDKWGRKFVFLCAGILNVFPRFFSLFLANNFTLFMILQFLVGMSYPMLYVQPLTILTEMCSNEYRSWIYASAWIIWVFGLSTLPLVGYLAGNWFTIGLITGIPGIIVFIGYCFIPESPRWLLSVGKVQEASDVIESVAAINGRSGELRKARLDLMLQALHADHKKRESTPPTAFDLFRNRTVGKNTLLVSIVWAVNALVYYGMLLNIPSMEGNQFVNFAVISLIELPPTLVAHPLVERFGRRWPQVIGMLFCFVGFVLAAAGAESQSIVILSIILSKVAVSITSLIVHLQTNEVFPTQLRSTAFGFAGMVSSFVVISAPMLTVYLGKTDPSRPYIAMGIMSLIGVICSSFIPETLNQSLPETIEDSHSMEMNAKFWSYLPKDYKEKVSISNANGHTGA